MSRRLSYSLPAVWLGLALVSVGWLSSSAFAADEFVPSQFPTIQAAIDASASGDTIFINDGTYTGPGNVDLDTGGRNITVESQNGAASTIIDCGGSSSSPHRGFNLHSGENGMTIRGLTIQNGYEDNGGAIYSACLRLLVDECVLQNNVATSGGAVYNFNNNAGNLTLLYCTLSGNRAQGGAGGGLWNESYLTGTTGVSHCTFIDNTASSSGGGISNYNASGGKFALSTSVFTGNTVPFSGSALDDFASGGTSAVSDSVFTGNVVNSTSPMAGGTINANTKQNGTLTLTSCTLTANSNATTGAFTSTLNSGATATLIDDILYNDTGGETTGTAFTASYCDIQGGYAGTNNINVDPLFVLPPGMGSGTDLHLQPGSLCLGAGTASGTPSKTIDGQTRPSPPAIGAYEVTAAPAATTLALVSYSSPSVAGQIVSFQATLIENGGAPTGTMALMIDGVAQPPRILGQGKTVYFLNSHLSVGSHTITASYSGDTDFGPSTSPPLTQVIMPHISPQYVSPSGSDSNSGTASAPKLTIQGGLNASTNGDTVIVEDGTYTGPGNVDLTSGGYTISVTSQNGPLVTIIDCGGSASTIHRGFNYQFGVAGSVISGLTIQNAYDNGGGAGIYNGSGTLTVQNCILKNNTEVSNSRGGGIYGLGNLTVIGCILSGNSAIYGAGIYGHGKLTVTGCTLSSNSASSGGGGLYNDNGTLSVTGSTFSGNSGYEGGALSSDTTTAGTFSLVNCVVAGNTASGGIGGGLFFSAYSGAYTLTNCTFTGNSNGALFNNSSGSTLTITNDIFYANTGGELEGTGNVVSYCDIQGGYTGTGNINADPLFVSVTDLHLQTGSPCLGAGTANGAPTTTIDGKTRPNPPSIGAYEMYQASTSVAVASASGIAGQSVTLSAALSASAGTTLAGKTLAFSVDGTAAGTAVTGSNGSAALTYAIPAGTAAGSHTITAAFAGDTTDLASSGTGTLSVSAAPPVGQVRYFPRVGKEIRMVGGQFQGSLDSSAWTTLATVSQTPPSGQYSTLPTSADPAAFRYLRYLAPNGSYGNVGEIEFDSHGVKLTGTAFGTAGSYNNNGNTFLKALDGNTSTYFDAPAPGNGDYVGIDRGPTYTKLSGTAFGTAGSYNNDGRTFLNVFDGSLNTYFDAPAPGNGDYAGIDLGAGHTAAVTRIGFCPRSGYSSRMVGGLFQGSNDNSTWTALYTVTAAPAAGTLTETTAIGSSAAFRYLRYLAPNGSYGNVAEVEFDTSP